MAKLGTAPICYLRDSSINNVITTVQQFQYCQGINENITDNIEILVENWSKTGNENSFIRRYRPKQCDIVLPFIYHNKTCSKCSLLTTPLPPPPPPKKEKNDENVKHDIKLPADHSDFVDILDKVIPECPERLKVFLVSQKNAVTPCPNERRWNKDVLRICLSLWCRSPRGYADLRSSGFVVLPSSRLLQYYKNSVNQVSGLNKEMLACMQNKAKNKILPPP